MRSAVKRASKLRRIATRPSRGGGRGAIIPYKAGEAILDDLRHRAASERNHRRAGGQRFDQHQPERFGPIDRKQQRRSIAEKLALLGVADLADELDPGVLHTSCKLTPKTITCCATHP